MRSNVEQGGDVSCDTLTIRTTYPPVPGQVPTIPLAITPVFQVAPTPSTQLQQPVRPLGPGPTPVTPPPTVPPTVPRNP